ncbi:hypothetical protein [Geothrix alkalitolerans]|uniref:hypothetical protein n=1 Tax=Geothrix alkalitolerans TaxID=2922724 RepID=UPI001FAF21C5|nr:hypothetical protein [Geothrix alkalitolerans]
MRRPRPAALLWGLFAGLSLAGAALRLRAPHTPALPWIGGALLVLLAFRLSAMALDWRRGRLLGTRLLLPGLLLAEGLGLALPGLTAPAAKVRLGIALVLEALLLVLALRAWRTARSTPGAWPEDRIAAAFEAFVPTRAARLMALELVMLGGALRFLLGGFRDPAPEGFSHHRESALRSFLPALPLLIPGDVLLMKALFSGLPAWARWTLHGSTVYAVLWLVGLYASIKARPHQVQDGEVRLHQGLVKSVAFPAASVRSAAPLPDFDDDWARHAHLKGVSRLVAKGAPLLELALAAPVRVDGMLGAGRPTQRLLVSVDDPAAFRAALGC